MGQIILKEQVIDDQVYPLFDEMNVLIKDVLKDRHLLLDAIDIFDNRRLLDNFFKGIDDIGENIYTIKNEIENIIYEMHVKEKRLESDYPSELQLFSTTSTLSISYLNDSVDIIDLVDTDIPNYVKYDFFKNIPKQIDKVLENTEACCNLYIYGNKFNDYKVFKNCLIDDRFVSKPCRDTSYATQGVCEIGGMTLITSYDTGYSKKDGKKEKGYSKLDIVGSDGEVKTLYFPHTAHVGGIGYCDELEMVYVCGEGKVEYYTLEQLAKATNNSMIIPNGTYEFDKVEGKGNEEITKASFLTTNKNDIWVGEFQFKKQYKKGSNPELMRYTTDELGNMIEGELYTLPWRNVQGMCITEYEGKEYYIFSTSEGRRKDSHLRVCVLENGSFVEKGNITMPCLSEQVSLTEDGNLMIIFESDCDKYGEGADNKGCATKQVGNVCFLDLEEVMDRCL